MEKMSIKCTNKGDDCLIFIFLYPKNNKVKIFDFRNNSRIYLDAYEYCLIKLDKKYKDKMITLYYSHYNNNFMYKYIILTSERNVPSAFGGHQPSYLHEDSPFNIHFNKLNNYLLEEENYYLFFQIKKGGYVNIFFANGIYYNSKDEIVKIKIDENAIFRFTYSFFDTKKNHFVQVIPCLNSEINIIEDTKNGTNEKTVSEYYIFNMNQNFNKINVYGNSYILCSKDSENINLEYKTSLNISDYNSKNLKINFDSFTKGENMNFYEIILFSSEIFSKDACQLYDLNKENKGINDYKVIKKINSASLHLEEYIQKKFITINNSYISIIGKSADYSYIYYEPRKVNYYYEGDYILEISLGISIPVIVIVIAIIIIYICCKKSKKSDNEILNANKTEELMPIPNLDI